MGEAPRRPGRRSGGPVRRELGRARGAFLMDAGAAIAAAAQRVGNWGRWGPDDALGTLNFIDDDKRARAAQLVRRGRVFSLANSFDANGPQRGWRNRVNPVHPMLSTGDDAVAGRTGFPHGIGGADDTVFMPLQCSTHWDGLGHIFDHDRAWNGRRASDVVTSAGDAVTGIEHATDRMVTRGVLLDVGRAVGGGVGRRRSRSRSSSGGGPRDSPPGSPSPPALVPRTEGPR